MAETSNSIVDDYRLVGLDYLAKSKIDQHNVTVLVKHDVLHLEITIHNIALKVKVR